VGSAVEATRGCGLKKSNLGLLVAVVLVGAAAEKALLPAPNENWKEGIGAASKGATLTEEEEEEEEEG